jgi:uncharacterized protein with PIN domain
MTCPNCPRPVEMLPVMTMECRTGNAKLFRCPNCYARHWQQQTDTVGINFRKLRETNQRLADLAAA